jgi:hypothetical protein
MVTHVGPDGRLRHVWLTILQSCNLAAHVKHMTSCSNRFLYVLYQNTIPSDQLSRLRVQFAL